MYCPLKFIRFSSGRNIWGCEKDKCAWWISHSNQFGSFERCAIVQIADPNPVEVQLIGMEPTTTTLNKEQNETL